MHSFSTSLKYGHIREEEFHKIFPKLIRTDGRLCDFLTESGERIEVKGESRTTDDTPNIALEIESSPGRPGAIYSAFKNKVKYFVYFFADKRYFIYDTKLLLDFAIKYDKEFRKVRVQNPTYKSTVILIPRAVIQCLETAWE